MTPPGDGDLGDFLAQMEQLQHQLVDAEAEAEASTVEGTSGGGAVRVRASGEFQFDAVVIDPSVLDADNAELVEDLVLAAIRDAANKLNAARKAALDDLMRGALGGLLGGALPIGTEGIVDDDPAN
jgi:DNA-binding YbaB/EbfC family protein